MRALLLHYRPGSTAYTENPPFSEARILLKGLRTDMHNTLETAKATSTTGKRQLLDGYQKFCKRRYEDVDGVVALNEQGYIVVTTDELSATLSEAQADALYNRLAIVNSSMNYGGNVEVGPPTEGAPLGKLIVGNDRTAGMMTMDSDLLTFLSAQKQQPVVEVSTSWLTVGHVDETLSIVPDMRPGNDMAILLASPTLALALLDAAKNQYNAGLGPRDPVYANDRPWTQLGRKTSYGTSPVTHLLRGKWWVFSNRGADHDPVFPPQFYRALASDEKDERAVGGGSFQFSYDPSLGDQTFAAHCNVFEALWYLRAPNQRFEADNLSANRAILEREFPGVPFFPIPVLYDLPSENGMTEGLLPNSVNLQIVGKRLFVPRPCGPRMWQADATAVLDRVFNSSDPASTFSELQGMSLAPALVDRYHLAETIHWERVGTRLSDVMRKFDSGFPDASDEDVETRIEQANPGAFVARELVGDGWRRLRIPENNIDLFEACVAAVAWRLDLDITWVDTWYYHMHHGEIHCGTNVVYAPPPAARQPWWQKVSH